MTYDSSQIDSDCATNTAHARISLLRVRYCLRFQMGLKRWVLTPELFRDA